MSIAVSTSPQNAISNITDLIDEVRDEMDDDAFDRERILRSIGRAEARFNRELRTPQMETAILFMATEEITDLPNDFLQMRLIYQEGTPDSPLQPLAPAQLRRGFQGVAGRPRAYAIENRRIIIAPVGSTALQMTYYQRIPALTDDNPTNWLIDEHPDLYLHQVLANLFNKIGDGEKAASNLAITNDLIAQIQAAAQTSAWGSGPLHPRRSCGVRGVII